MPENPDSGPGSSDRLDGLFQSLPDPAKADPVRAAGPPAPGSRRAAREAAERGAKHEGGAAEPAARSDLDELLDSGSTPTQKRRTSEGRRGGCIVALIIVLAVLGGIAAAGVWVYNTYGDRIMEALGMGEPTDWEGGDPGDPVLITISAGDTGAAVSRTLHEAGVLKTATSLYDYMVREQLDVPFYAGVYEVRQHLSAAEALEALADPANKRENSVLLREGLTVDRSVTEIANALSFPIEDVEAAVADPSAYGVDADSLEGWIFPALYTFDAGVTPKQVIERMVQRTRQALNKADVPAEDAHRILTIASIIEREARYEQDFYQVSRVIQNRMSPANKETNGLLQMDSTAQYGVGQLHDGSASSSADALKDDNLWNTYIHPGLPVGPIANPGELAIDAAMNPADGPWFYFVTINDATGETVFTNTYAEHQRAIELRRAWCREDPESRCK